MDMDVELVQLCVGTTVLKHSAYLGALVSRDGWGRSSEMFVVLVDQLKDIAGKAAPIFMLLMSATIELVLGLFDRGNAF